MAFLLSICVTTLLIFLSFYGEFCHGEKERFGTRVVLHWKKIHAFTWKYDKLVSQLLSIRFVFLLSDLF